LGRPIRHGTVLGLPLALDPRRPLRHEACLGRSGARCASGKFGLTMNRVLIVSNRLPVSVVRTDGKLQLQRSAGGLATGLAAVHSRSKGVWIGWPGDAGDLTAAEQQVLEEQWKAWRLAPVPLSAQEVEGFYECFCNGVLWPVLHYRLPDVWRVRAFLRELSGRALDEEKGFSAA
jgi:hypothetical protein